MINLEGLAHLTDRVVDAYNNRKLTELAYQGQVVLDDLRETEEYQKQVEAALKAGEKPEEIILYREPKEYPGNTIIANNLDDYRAVLTISFGVLSLLSPQSSTDKTFTARVDSILEHESRHAATLKGIPTVSKIEYAVSFYQDTLLPRSVFVPSIEWVGRISLPDLRRVYMSPNNPSPIDRIFKVRPYLPS